MEPIYSLFKNDNYKFVVQNDYEDRFYNIYFPQFLSHDAIISINENPNDANSVFEYVKNIFENETNGIEFSETILNEIVSRVKSHIETNYKN